MYIICIESFLVFIQIDTFSPYIHYLTDIFYNKSDNILCVSFHKSLKRDSNYSWQSYAVEQVKLSVRLLMSESELILRMYLKISKSECLLEISLQISKYMYAFILRMSL